MPPRLRPASQPASQPAHTVSAASRSHSPPPTLSPAINGSHQGTPTPGRVHSTAPPHSLTGGARNPSGPVSHWLNPPSGLACGPVSSSHPIPERIGIYGCAPETTSHPLWAAPPCDRHVVPPAARGGSHAPPSRARGWHEEMRASPKKYTAHGVREPRKDLTGPGPPRRCGGFHPESLRA